MSEIEQQLMQWANEAADRYNHTKGRADSYKRQGNDEKALENYIEALEEYAVYVKQKSKVISVGVAIDTQNIAPQRAKAHAIFAITLFGLFQILSTILDYYESNSIVHIYLKSRFLAIAKELGKYERAFDSEQINYYEDIKRYVRLFQYQVTQHQEQLAALEPLNKESNQDFKRIRQALSEISNEKICPITLEESGGCFIVTVAYADYFHPDLKTFRNFRDSVLMKNTVGRFCVRIYYKIGPYVAQHINRNSYLKTSLRFCFNKIAYLMRLSKL